VPESVDAPAFLALLFVAGILSGATASIAGFGIGSLLTPLFAANIGMTTAIAAVAIPHAIATAVRGWRLRRSIDWRVMRSFGIASAVGGFAGALLYTRFSNRGLSLTLGVLLIATAIAAWTDWARRARLGPSSASVFGFVSGGFGGVAGNQGGLRAAALFAFHLAPAAFVATSTATGLLVDAARLPLYLWRAGGSLVPLAAPIGAATAGVLIGTIAGERVLMGMGVDTFRRVVATLVGVLGAWILVRAW
jgi:uncharacterized membrane protein YfcA